ncbi:hypothetical protein HPP92_020069 [Vanilla planifolia]|uniref:Uncharacterized protein n=1 Tax=Vanilla planifolia TaxID=51239 RepID=A0A835Q423_VANPL|nr:hypothetical protein HPP92_020069 [Vanilla planifolia]
MAGLTRDKGKFRSEWGRTEREKGKTWEAGLWLDCLELLCTVRTVAIDAWLGSGWLLSERGKYTVQS